MNVGFNFDANANDVIKSGYEPLESGDYIVRITKCPFGPTSDNMGQQFSFEFTVIEGPYAKRTVRDNVYWTWSGHDSAVEFGHRKLASILLAIGHPHFGGDTDEFLGGVLTIKVKKEEYTKNDGTTGVRNNISEYCPCESSAPAAPNTVVNSIPQTPSAPKGPVLGGGVPVNPFAGRR